MCRFPETRRPVFRNTRYDPTCASTARLGRGLDGYKNFFHYFSPHKRIDPDRDNRLLRPDYRLPTDRLCVCPTPNSVNRTNLVPGYRCSGKMREFPNRCRARLDFFPKRNKINFGLASSAVRSLLISLHGSIHPMRIIDYLISINVR